MPRSEEPSLLQCGSSASSALNNPDLPQNRYSKGYSVGCFGIQARQGFVVAWVNRAASVGKVDVVLGQ